MPRGRHPLLGRPPRGQAPPAVVVGGRNPPPPTHRQPRGRRPCHGQRETAAHRRPPARSGPPRAGRRPHRGCRSQSRLQSGHPSRSVAAPTRHTRQRTREPRRTGARGGPGLSHTRADGRSTHARRRARRGAPPHTPALPATRRAGRRAPPRASDKGDAAPNRADHGEPCAPVGWRGRPVPTGKKSHSCQRAVAATAARQCCGGAALARAATGPPPLWTRRTGGPRDGSREALCLAVKQQQTRRGPVRIYRDRVQRGSDKFPTSLPPGGRRGRRHRGL